jgi:hypothetical protein
MIENGGGVGPLGPGLRQLVDAVQNVYDTYYSSYSEVLAETAKHDLHSQAEHWGLAEWAGLEAFLGHSNRVRYVELEGLWSEVGVARLRELRRAYKADYPNISARFPLAWIDPDILCDECGVRPAEYSNAWASRVFCGECSQDMDDE